MTRARDVANIDGILTTTGDTFYASAAATPDRLGIGSTGQVLTVAGGVPSWATPAGGGGMTLLSTTALSGATVTVSGISGSYQNLLLIIQGMTNATGNGQPELRINGSTGINYTTGTRDVTAPVVNDGQFFLAGNSAPNSLNTSVANVWAIEIYDYAQTSYYKAVNGFGIFQSSASVPTTVNLAGAARTNSAITSFTLLNTGGNLNGGQVKVYGVK